MTRPFFLLLFFILAVAACSTEKMNKKYTRQIAPHGGVLLIGKKYDIELVSKKNNVMIYTLENQKTGNHKVVPTKESKVYARYSPRKSLANWGLPLVKEESRYLGLVDPRGEDAYEIYLDLKVNGKKEKYSYTIVLDKQKN